MNQLQKVERGITTNSKFAIPGNPPIPITVNYSMRARRFSLTVHAVGGDVVLTAPRNSNAEDALPWLVGQREYILERRCKAKSVVVPEFGTNFPLEGAMVRLAKSNTASVRLEGDTLLLPGRNEDVPPLLMAFCKQRARKRAKELAGRFCVGLGVKYNRISVRDTRTRWGSCSPTGTLSFCWRLIIAPPEVFGYVVAHEVAHLKFMDHSKDFWNIVEKLCPHYERYRSWLKLQGNDLFRFKLE